MIENKRILELPLNGRNPFGLVSVSRRYNALLWVDLFEFSSNDKLNANNFVSNFFGKPKASAEPILRNDQPRGAAAALPRPRRHAQFSL
jgi:hypothetical protein